MKRSEPENERDSAKEISERTEEMKGAAVVTRSQAKVKRQLSPLVVPGPETVEREVLIKGQSNVITLKKYWSLVGKDPAKETKEDV